MRTMKRIEAAIKNVLSNAKCERKVSHANRMIDTAIDNAKDKMDDLDFDMQTCLESLAKSDNVTDVIKKLCSLKAQKEEQEETIKTLQWAKEYINEEVEVDEEEKSN